MTAVHETPRMSAETEQNAASANPQKGGECWEVFPCVNRMGNIVSYDIGPPTEPDAKGGVVIASVYAGEQVARQIAGMWNSLRAAREIVNEHCEYMDGLNRGQVMMRTSAAVAALADALSRVDGQRKKLTEVEYLARQSGQTFIADLIGEVLAAIPTAATLPSPVKEAE